MERSEIRGPACRGLEHILITPRARRPDCAALHRARVWLEELLRDTPNKLANRWWTSIAEGRAMAARTTAGIEDVVEPAGRA